MINQLILDITQDIIDTAYVNEVSPLQHAITQHYNQRNITVDSFTLDPITLFVELYVSFREVTVTHKYDMNANAYRQHLVWLHSNHPAPHTAILYR